MKSRVLTFMLCSMVLLVGTGCDLPQLSTLLQDLGLVAENIVAEFAEMLENADFGPFSGEWHGGR
jgi:hypothetical protein